jgi:hypothetical protein
MKTLKLALCAVMLTSMMAFAAPPPGRTEPAKWGNGEPDPARLAEMQKGAHMMAVVAIAEALELNEADALKLSATLKGLEERRHPIRAQMHEAMKAVKAAAEGDASAFAQVDANIQKVLDGRAQMAALDKEMFVTLGKDQSPQKRAKLAVVLAKLHEGGRGGGKGRHQ